MNNKPGRDPGRTEPGYYTGETCPHCGHGPLKPADAPGVDLVCGDCGESARRAQLGDYGDYEVDLLGDVVLTRPRPRKLRTKHH